MTCVDAAYLPLPHSRSAVRVTTTRECRHRLTLAAAAANAPNNNKNDDDDDEPTRDDNRPLQLLLEDWLDRPFFDPNDHYEDDESSA
jgi:hypothetical protein